MTDPDDRVLVGWSRADAPAAADRVLSVEERARMARLRDPAGRAGFRSARVLLRRMLAEALGVPPGEVPVVQRCPACDGPHGRPSVGGRDRPHLSLSRSADRVVAALSYAGPVGIDVESVTAVARAPFDDVALAPAERAALGRAADAGRDPDAVRAGLWVRKESLLKATGQGLTVPPAGVVVSVPGTPPELLGWDGPGDPGACRMADLDLGAAYRGCVAVLTGRPVRVEIREVSLTAAG